MEDYSKYSRLIKAYAGELGFDDCGIAEAAALDDHALVLQEWLDQGHQADMKWMNNHFNKRIDPRKLVPGAKSVVSLLLNYYNPANQEDPASPVISRYAYGRDYHKVIKKLLKKLLKYTQEIIPGTKGRVFTDSAPVLEHAWAARAGVGWIGKNSLILSRKSGSYVFLAEMIIDAPLEYDIAIKDYCGNCRICVDECPTHAILPGRTVDANKCISWMTIENNGAIPEKYKHSMYNRVYGCDICQDVCPWNRKLKKHNIPDFDPDPKLMKMSRDKWYNLTEEEFNELFEGSAVKRAGFEGLKRNLNFLAKHDPSG